MQIFEEQKGNLFSDKYFLGEELGQGMHASVYKCYAIEDKDRLKPYAVKLIRESDDEKKLAHKNEFTITKSLNNENVIKSLEMFDNELKGEIHIVMEYVEGIEVLDNIAEQPDGHYTEQQAKMFFRQVMQGIKYLHENGVAHRDIKPQNLLCCKKNNRLVIVDFNVSTKKKDTSFKMMTKTGTVAFSAPEIFT